MNSSIGIDKIPITLPPPVRHNSRQLNKKSLQTVQSHSDKSHKEPKFVPYEPYKGAVKPIVGKINVNKSIVKKPLDKTIIATADAAIKKKDKLHENKVKPLNEMTNVATVMPRLLTKLPLVSTEQKKCICDQEDSSTSLQEELEQMKTENANLKDELLQQTKVNAELKKLLIASVGDDLECKLQFLTEDKVKLAYDIHHYVQRLLADHEELEKLSIQCDVWRSKFLASSLIVDELANWKAMLSHRYDESLEALRMLLDEHCKIRNSLSTSYRCLKDIESTYSPALTQHRVLSTPTIVELSDTVEKLVRKLHVKLKDSSKSLCSVPQEEQLLTTGEEKAQQILDTEEHPSSSLHNLPLECTKLLSCVNLRSGVANRFHPNTRYEHLTMNCCSQCQGEIQLL